jgi:signal transduction histidine kinase/DNA-binding NarL/FixJ family response regulator
LRGRTRGPCLLDSDEFDEAGYLRAYGEVKFFVSFYRIAKLQLLYLFGNYEEAQRMAEAAEEVAYSTEGMIWDAWRCFYRALTLAARCPSLETGPRDVALGDLQSLLGRLRVWAENSHENFGHRYQLVLAETAALRGDTGAAMDAYEQAVREAAEHRFVQIEAIANECYARFWLRRGNEAVAAVYLRAAERCYARWGAAAKLQEMRSRYPHRALHLPDPASGRHWREAIDLGTVMKAAQVVSGEVEQGRLLGSFMRILLESAGARKGFLLLEREGRLLVEAEGTVEGESRVLQGVAAGSGPDLPSAIVHYSARLGETLILSDCSRDERFADDPYVQACKPLSVLCMPVLHQGKPIGLLYLENNLVRDAFTSDDVELIGILASQAAISFTNVRLYEEMRQEVAERKQVEEALKKAHDQLESRIAERTGQLSRANERLETEIREREEIEIKLKEAKEAAEAASRAKTEFLASMSHELRTPLNAILGYAQILRRRGDLDGAARSGVATIERSGEHLLTLINDILSLSKIEAGKLEATPSDFDLTVFLQNICDMARVRARTKGLAFRFETKSPLPALVHGEERWLRQILLNLLSNASKFTDRGGLTLRAAGEAIASGTVHLQFEVEDTGVGIPLEQQQRIFEPFEQVHGAARSQEGTGLGLAISKQLVQCMGGAIQVFSKPGDGSLFRVELPLSPQTGTSAAPQERPVVGYRGRPRKILIADDKADNRSVLVGLLAPLGFELSEAADGRAALEAAIALRPDAVLLDLVMPRMDGFEAARRMRATPALADLVILALSASVFEEDRRRSASAGCHGFLAKPVDAGLLLEKLQEHLSLEWTYAEEPFPAESAGSETVGADLPLARREEIPCPPAARLQVLQRLAETGDIRAIERELDAIEESQGPYLVFVRRMRELAAEYDMGGIADFVRRHLDPASETGRSPQ